MIFIAYNITCYGIGYKVHCEDSECHYNKAEGISVHDFDFSLRKFILLDGNYNFLRMIADIWMVIISFKLVGVYQQNLKY